MPDDAGDPVAPARFARALLAEDNPFVAMNTEALLMELGIEDVVVASNLREAIEQADAGGFDLAVLDIHLGNETVGEAALRLDHAGVPIIFTSGANDPATLPAALRHHRILTKPWLLRDLERAIAAL